MGQDIGGEGRVSIDMHIFIITFDCLQKKIIRSSLFPQSEFR